MTWPLTLEVDDSIALLTPSDLTDDSPLAFLEVQRLRNEAGEVGTRVVYATPDRITHYAWPREFDLAAADVPLGEGIGLNEPADFAADTLQMGADGITIDVDFTDAQGRRLTLALRQPRPWRGFDFMAPPAAGMSDPASFFFPYLRQFSFVPPPLTFAGTFAGRHLQLRRLAFPWNWRPAFSQKAARGVVVVELLKDGSPALGADDPGTVVDADGALLQVRRPNEIADVVVAFDPALPPAADVRTAHQSQWSMTVGGDRVASGSVILAPQRNELNVAWKITRGWSGVPQPGPAWVLTRLIRFLTRWPTAYSWAGTLAADGALRGKWRNARVKR